MKKCIEILTKPYHTGNGFLLYRKTSRWHQGHDFWRTPIVISEAGWK